MPSTKPVGGTGVTRFGNSSCGANTLVGTGANGSIANGLKFAPLACALPFELPPLSAAGNTEASVLIGKRVANSWTETSRPGAISIVTFFSPSARESKNGSTVTVDWLSNRIISFSPT
ncbi:hypothetical protein ACVMB1_001552 [Bradyrhizobium sp. USDA 4504]